MHGRYVWQFLAVLALAKVIATSLSFSSGTPGGMFAPTLFIGAMVGGAIGGLQHHFFPALTAGVGAYALVGMGTLFAGFLRAPMTSVFMVLEVSGNYSIIRACDDLQHDRLPDLAEVSARSRSSICFLARMASSFPLSKKSAKRNRFT